MIFTIEQLDTMIIGTVLMDSYPIYLKRATSCPACCSGGGLWLKVSLDERTEEIHGYTLANINFTHFAFPQLIAPQPPAEQKEVLRQFIRWTSPPVPTALPADCGVTLAAEGGRDA